MRHKMILFLRRRGGINFGDRSFKKDSVKRERERERERGIEVRKGEMVGRGIFRFHAQEMGKYPPPGLKARNHSHFERDFAA